MGTEFFILLLSLLFFISISVGKIGGRFGVPALLLFIEVGMAFGNDGLDIIRFDDLKVAETIGTVALCIILFSGGLMTKLEDIRPIIPQSIVLATVGVLLTAFITGFFVWWLCGQMLPSIGIGLVTALLFASCMSSTDSASVFAILGSKGLKLKNNLTPTLEMESGSNDPMAYVLTITFIGVIMDSAADLSVCQVIISILLQLIVGTIAGYGIGKLAAYILNRVGIDNEAYYPILLLTFCLFIFSITYFIHGNSYLAIYVSGFVIGNSKFNNKRSCIRFFDALSWLAQISVFLMLGLLVNPQELLQIAVIGMIVGLFLIFVARPVTVFLCLLPFRKIGFRDNLFISWVGLRGAVPIIFAIYPLTAGVPHARFIFNVVFFITLLSLLLQGTLINNVARWLGLANEGKTRKKSNEFELEMSEDIGQVTSEMLIEKDALAHGSRLMDLPLPAEALVVMVKRGDDYFIPKGKTEMRQGDKLLIIADNKKTLERTYKSLHGD
ncbi:MAG: potassium/proton antiporter [Prevotella sp.]|jgi:cell volume regulation protein A|nr:potassium/proton antiporter [Prevotella sp.]